MIIKPKVNITINFYTVLASLADVVNHLQTFTPFVACVLSPYYGSKKYVGVACK